MRKKSRAPLTWREYVLRTIGDDRQVDVARRLQIDQATISRWMRAEGPVHPSAPHVREFARIYGRPTLEAFIVAGLLSAEEAGQEFPTTVDLSMATDQELVDELQRRLRRTRPRRVG